MAPFQPERTENMTYKNLSTSSPISTITSSRKPQVSIPKCLLLDFRIVATRTRLRTSYEVPSIILHLTEKGGYYAWPGQLLDKLPREANKVSKSGEKRGHLLLNLSIDNMLNKAEERSICIDTTENPALPLPPLTDFLKPGRAPGEWS